MERFKGELKIRSLCFINIYFHFNFQGGGGGEDEGASGGKAKKGGTAVKVWLYLTVIYSSVLILVSTYCQVD